MEAKKNWIDYEEWIAEEKWASERHSVILKMYGTKSMENILKRMGYKKDFRTKFIKAFSGNNKLKK